MSKKITFIMVILLVIMLAACQKDDQTESKANNDQSNQSNTEEVDSEDQTVDTGEEPANEDTSSSNDSSISEDSESSSKVDVDDESDASTSEPIGQGTNPVKEESYSSEEEAINAIEGYHEIEQTNVDLGHEIKGFVEGAAGHQYVSWNEGNWLIEIDFPSDPQYAVSDYEDGKSMAKAIVNYLEDHMLRPPDQRGIIKINGFSDSAETWIRWQQGTTVYEIDQKTSDPIEVLQIAVDQTDNQ
ncbi:hypothetical protein CWR48_11555 [Oceanobacillus arenosus]|uniref:Lipoprotein n=1 Tax=Oceanobacillus arenosus TaxID=1229153 RepID=A0A3D8PTB4_9BACI|nr:hypothetical protein [Oceanobacillus arenosus]RDW18215.1 hypothetical protein CWR48_11555 [Oceanobacillus arenosus]